MLKHLDVLNHREEIMLKITRANISEDNRGWPAIARTDLDSDVWQDSWLGQLGRRGYRSFTIHDGRVG